MSIHKMLLPWEKIVIRIENLPYVKDVVKEAESISQLIIKIEDQEVQKALETLLRFYKIQIN